MFKSVFAKYVTVFMVIITLGFALLLLIVTSIVNNYSATMKRNVMENAAGATRVALEATVYDAGPIEAVSLLESVGQDYVCNLLNEFADRDDDLAVTVMSPTGEELYTIEGGDWTTDVPSIDDKLRENLPKLQAGNSYSDDLAGAESDDISFCNYIYFGFIFIRTCCFNVFTIVCSF